MGSGIVPRAVEETQQWAADAASRLAFADYVKRRRRRRLAAYVSVAVGLFGIVVAAGLFTRSEPENPELVVATSQPPPEETPSTTTGVGPEAPQRPVGFVPATRAEADSIVVSLGFVDGTSADLSYPAEFDFLSRGIELEGAFGTDGYGRSFTLRHGSIADQVAFRIAVDGGGELLQSYPDPRGGSAELWRFGGDDNNIDSLFVAIGPWTLETWDYQANRSEARDRTLTQWINSLQGDVAASGFVVLAGSGSLQLPPVFSNEGGPDGPDLRLGGEDGDILLFLNQCGLVAGEDGPEDGVLEWCDNATQTRVAAFGEPDRLLDLQRGLAITNLIAPSGEITAGVSPYVDEGFCGDDNMPEGWRDSATDIGTLALWGFGPFSQTGDGADSASKTIALVYGREPVTLSVPAGWRRQVSHLFDDSIWNSDGRYFVDPDYGSVTFAPCEEGPAQFVGGFVYKPEARCAFLEAHGAVEGAFTVPLDGGSCNFNWARHVDEEIGLTLSYPEDWYLAPETLTPVLGFPMVAAVSTFEAPTGGDRCAQFATGALDAVGPEDVLMTIHELPVGYALRPRPDSFRSETGVWSGDLEECMEGRLGDLRGGQFRYSDSGRAFDVILAMGADVPAEDEDTAWAMLNSFVPLALGSEAGVCAPPQDVVDRLVALLPDAPAFPEGWVETDLTLPKFNNPDLERMATAAGAHCSSVWTHTTEDGEEHQLVAIVGATASGTYLHTTDILDTFVSNAPTRGLTGIGDLDIQRHDDDTLAGRYNSDQFILIALDGWDLDYFIDIWDAASS
ncbi:MAG: hypothetical protein QNJ75_04220 [Acidimicrobiia bacterium]|nr:hypothetical protein [Acidimicrobiia bacterium]